MTDKHGDFVWYELMTGDADAAQAFYGPLLGWTFESGDAPGIDYRLGGKGGTEIVGLMQLNEMREGGASPAWIGYIAVDAIDASLASLKKRGGTVFMGPNHMEGVGHMAMVADPQGVPFYLMQPEGEASQSFAKHEPREGFCAWNELITDDPQAAGEFYTGMFGWEKGDAMYMGELGPYQMFMQDDYGLGAIMKRPDEMPASSWAFYFRVPEIGAAQAFAESNGAQLVNGPMEIPGGEFVFQGIDPQGAFFSIIGPKGS